MNQLSPVPKVGAEPYRVKADGFLRMIGAGAFGDEHVELVGGVLVKMAPAQFEHSRISMVMARLLGNAYLELDFVLCGDVITRFDEDTVRAPDIAVIDKDIGGRKIPHPSDILLAVEISDSTLAEDLGRKRIDYAASGIRHYWVVDVDGRRIHCYADPQGADYATIQVIGFGCSVSVPGTRVAITVA